MRAPLRLQPQRRYYPLRPIRRPVLTPTYAWRAVTVYVWAPTS